MNWIRRWAPRSGGFFWNLYRTYVAVVFCCTALVAALVFEFHEANARENMSVRIAQMAALLASLVAANPGELWTPVADNRVEELAKGVEVDIDIVLADGTVMASSRGADRQKIDLYAVSEYAQARASGEGETIYRREDGSHDVYKVARAIVIGSEYIGYVRVSKSTRSLSDGFTQLGSMILGGALLASLASLVGGIYFARTVTRPLESIERGCLRIAAGDLDYDFDLRRGDEFGVVARTMRRMAEALGDQMRRIEHQGNRSELLLRLLHDGVLAIGVEGELIFINQSALQYCGAMEAGDLIGKSYDAALFVEPLKNFITTARSSQSEVERSVQWLGEDGQKRHASVYFSPLKAEEHDLVGHLVVIRDTTEPRRFEALRQDFASNVSHELKTPITAIETLVDALQQGAKNEPELLDSFLGRVRLQNQRLNRLVDELLALSKLESGKQILQLKKCDIRDVFKILEETFLPVAAARGLAFEVSLPEGELRVSADLRSLEVAVNCLVDNAMKYTPAGGRVAVSLVAERRLACIQVVDTGCGIAVEHQERVFERFHRIDTSRTRSRGGSGLGLAIVKHIAIAHGGAIDLQSDGKTGSRFTITIPQA